MFRSLVCAIATLQAGCAVITPVAPAAQLEGRQVRTSALEVVEDFTFRPALYSVTFPAGIYAPAFQDSTHYCFSSTKTITGRNILGGMTVRGGLCVAQDSWDKRVAYIDDGTIYKFEITVPVKVRVVAAP